MPKLIINPTSSSRREIALARTLVSIGRDPTNDVVLPDAMVSRRHAVIEYRGSQYFLRDCNSSNGSLVNGDRVSERNLRDGDLVAIGTARLLFREEMEEAGAKVVPHPSAPRQVCPSCQADYRKGDLFCKQCGASLAPLAPARAVCTSCGTAVLLPARFCNACGHALEDAAVSADGSSVEGTRPRARPAPAAPPDPAAANPVASESAPPPQGADGPADAVGAVSPEAPDADGGPAKDGAPSPDVPSPPRLSRGSVESGSGRPPLSVDAGRSSPAPAMRALPSAAPALSPSAARDVTPASAPPMIGPRPSPSIVPRPEAARRPESRPTDAPAPPAGFGVRAAAGLLDGLLVGTGQAVLLGPVFYYWYEHWWSHPPATPADVAFWPILVSLVLVPVVLALGAVYYVYHWGVQGATPAQRLLGLVVQAEDGSAPIGTSRAATRVLGYLLSGVLLGIGFLMIAFGGFGLHDRLAGTRVVRRERG
jgi:uncharacterized RDD family membrane protein YckC